MRIIVNHLTRMQAGYICVAGINPATGLHVRPLPRAHNRFGVKRLARHGGPFEIGCVVDLGRAAPAGNPPEIEDHLITSSQALRVKDVPPAEFWTLLEKLAKPRLRDIFGPDLVLQGRQSCIVPVGKGQVSLGCLRLAVPPELYLRPRDDGRPQVRMRLSDEEFQVDVPVTDIRLYGADHVVPDSAVVERTAAKLQSGSAVVLSVGISRPYSSAPGVLPAHWLQVNNFHFEDDPCWKLG